MSEYQALYRAWRPEQFKDIYGQEPVTRTLRRQIVSGHIAHAYLFCGSRGTGKTTTAKVLSRAINCTDNKDGEPCGECEVCRQLKNESTLDVLEIDAASNNGVDEVRTLRDNISYTPTVGKYKVYIIDEVHMLSTSAFNALLKTLEEPPKHAVFILATTEPQKLPATVLSRCQRYDFKRISVKDISARLCVVLKGIGRACTDEAVEEIAVAADGGMRDALSLMDMCLSYTDGEVDAALVRQVLGSNGREFMFDFTDALCDRDAAKALSMISEAMLDGRDPAVFTREVAAHLRTVLIAQTTGESVRELCELTGEAAKRFLEQAQRYEMTRLMRTMDDFIKAEGDMRYVAMPRSVIELCAVRACRVSNEKTPDGMNERLEALERQLREGSFSFTTSDAATKETKPTPAPKPAARETAAQAVPAQDAEMPLFRKAAQLISEKNKSLSYALQIAVYNKTEGNVIYLSIPDSMYIQKNWLDEKHEEIDKTLSEVYGRPMKLNVTLFGDSKQAPGKIDSQLLTEISDFGSRDKLEIL